MFARRGAILFGVNRLRLFRCEIPAVGFACGCNLRRLLGHTNEPEQFSLLATNNILPLCVHTRQLRNGPVNLNQLSEIDMSSEVKQRICWLDMEMTGLDPDKDTIMEVSCVITDKDLNEIAKIEQIIVHQPEYVLNAMNDWCKNQHGASGLTEACLKSKITIKEAEDTILSFLQKHTTPHEVPLGGNSVYADRQFIRRYMPRVYDHLHYRIIDVSSISELCKRWYPDIQAKCPEKKHTHRAYDDIIESIEQLRYYRKTLFK